MALVFLVFLFITGAAVGSFLNVVIDRSIGGEQWKTGRSHCDFCGKTLAWFDMIPILTYAVYRGKSRCCHKQLSIQHPVVEILMGALFSWWYFVGSMFFRLVSHPLSVVQPTFWLVTGIILLAILVTDLFYGLIPSFFVGAGVVITATYRLVLAGSGIYQWRDLGGAIVIACIAWSFFWLIRYVTSERGMGDGDVILAFYLAFLMGWPKAVAGILFSFVLGALISTVLLILKVKSMKNTIPFGPFMVTGSLIALLWGDSFFRLIGF